MRVGSRSLGLFVPGSYTVPDNPFFPGLAGLQEFVGASFSVPQNPFFPGLAGLAEFVDASYAVPQNPILDGVAGLADFAPSSTLWPIPANSVLVESGLAGLRGADDCGCGCGGHGTCGQGTGLSGFTDWIGETKDKLMAGDPMTIAMVAGGGLLLFMLLGRTGSNRAGYREARKKALAKVRAEYPTNISRARRAASAF